MISAKKQTESYNYESNEAFSRQAAEDQATAYLTNTADSYVCAICRSGNTHRIKTKVSYSDLCSYQ